MAAPAHGSRTVKRQSRKAIRPIFRLPRSWVREQFRLVGRDGAHWSEFERGKHFPAMEAPGLLAADLQTFFGPLQ